MKIDPARHSPSSSPPTPFRILTRTLIILAVLAGLFFVAARSLEEIAANYLLSHFQLTIPSDSDGQVELPNERFSASLSLNRLTHDNYISLSLSGGDTYRVTFTRDDDSDFILVSTTGREDTDFLYLVPEAIAGRGYETITVAPMRGDGVYWVAHVRTHADPDPSDFPGHFLVDFEIKKLEITIEETDFARLEAKRAEALDLGILLTEEADYVPAVVAGDGKRDRAEVRLKGDWTDNIAGDKWAFRIIMDDEPIWGLKKLSLHSPESRNGVGEYLLHTFYRQQGQIAPRYLFADVLVNGEYWGGYAVEEFFDKRMVENSRYREGPVIKPNEDRMWEGWAYYTEDFSTDVDWIDFETFATNYTLRNPSLTEMSAYAITMLNKFTTGSIDASEIIDLDAAARYYAALDIFSACHGSTWHNMRYYFNPVTAKLQPITFDEEPLFGLCESSSKKNDPLINPLFEDEVFAGKYVHYADEFLREYKAFIKSESDHLSRIAYIFSRDGIAFQNYSEDLQQYHAFIRTTLKEDLNSFFLNNTTPENIVLTVDKDGFLNIQIESIAYENTILPVDPPRFSSEIIMPRKLFSDGQIQADLLEVTYTTLHDDQSHTQIAQENALAVSFFTAGHVYGNPRISGTNTQDDVYTPFANILKTIAEDDDIQFGVLTGDTVFEPSVESYENLINALKTTAKPIYAAPGNHDLDGSGLFQSYFGSTYQSFTTAGNLFIVLTPGEDWALDPVQLAFFENTVENHKWSSDNIFIFTHQLFWLEMDDQRFPEIQPNSWANKNGEGNFWSAVKPIFSNYPGDVYFIAGDVGAFPDRKAVFYGRDGNLHFIASGMGGGVNDNILVVDAFADGSVVFDLIAINGDDPAALGDLGDW